MISFIEFLTEGNPLARVQKHSDTGRHFVAVSAFRGSLSHKQNKKRHAALKNAVKKLGYGYREAEGHWEGGKEKSLMVHAKHPGDDHGKQLGRDVSRLSKHFNQDAYLHHDGKTASLHGTNKTGYPGRGKKDNVGKLSYNNSSSPYQTELRFGKKSQPARFTTKVTESDARALFFHVLESTPCPHTHKIASAMWLLRQKNLFEQRLAENGVLIVADE